MKFLVIGGVGFIGCNFAELLLMRGDDVVVFDNLSRPGTQGNLDYLKDKFPQMEFVRADIRSDQQTLDELMETVDAVYHLAGQVAVTTSVASPREDFEINALGTFNVLEAIRKSTKRPPIIYSSTNKVYGGMKNIPIVEKNGRYEYRDLAGGISEEFLLDFHSPYGCSKGAGDQYVRDNTRPLSSQTGVRRQKCIYGKRHFGIEDQGWVAWFTIAAILGKKITIYGDGMQIRDALYIDDLFQAWDLAVKKIDKTSGEVYNIGGGPKFTMSLLELIGFLEDFLGKNIDLSYADWRPGDQPVYVSNLEKARKEIGWQPQTGVEEGVRVLAEWVRDNKSLFDW